MGFYMTREPVYIYEYSGFSDPETTPVKEGLKDASLTAL